MLLKKKAFTLIELIITIFIISTILSIVTISISKTRENARNNQRVQDILQIQLALEEYYYDHDTYPEHLIPGETLEKGGKVYLHPIPHNPRPQSDGSCPSLDYKYGFDGKKYKIEFCLSQEIKQINPGSNCAQAIGIISGHCNF
ncbi:MAG TPA: prepilin-type N-terminal cleavage/methylation domain-containing protein [Patescibacteria group bacterium]|jgi:prepilin-type N-terminal cleavage/methylation domain-containing protein|nr:prepilin-type N-terminal cleavage/methylation domain-containing protein [Patescibacteria group bacterium]